MRGDYNEVTHKWKGKHEALLSSPTYDFRDLKFSVDSDDRLCLVSDGSIIGPEKTTSQMAPHVAFQVNEEWQVEKAKVDPEIKCEKRQRGYRKTKIFFRRTSNEHK